MTLRERLANMLLGRAAGDPSAVNPAVTVPDFQAGRPVYNTWSAQKAILEGYKAHAVVYACVRRLALDVASVPWQVKVGEDISETHRGAKLIARPNPRFAWSDMMELLTLDLNLAGNGYWYHIQNGQTDEVWRMRPDRMKVVPARDGTIVAWEHKLGNQITRIPPEQVVHFKAQDPGNDFYGMSPLQAIARTVDTDNDAIDGNKASLQNRATPAGALISKPSLTPEQITRFRELLKSQTEGAANARKTMVLYGDLSWQQFGLSPLEMDYLNSLAWSARLICAAFGVHPDATGLVDATYKNQRAAHRATWENTIIPFLADQAEALDIQLIPFLGGDAHFVYDLSQTPAVTEARKERSEEASRYFALGISPRAINKHLGLGFDPEDCSETGFVPTKLVPIGEAVPGIPATAARRQRSFNLETEEERARHWRRFDRQREAWERIVEEQVRGQFAQEASRVEAIIESGGRELDSAVDSGRYEWARMLEAVWRAVIEQFGGEVAEELEGRARAVRNGVWDPWEPNVQAFVQQTVGDHVVEITDTTKAALRAAMQEAIAANESSVQIAARIRGLYEGYGRARAAVIARTEVGAAANYGTHEAAKQSGVVQTHTWLSSRDPRVRDSHVEIDGETKPLGVMFSNGCMQPCDPAGPAAETIQCRCVETFGIEVAE